MTRDEARLAFVSDVHSNLEALEAVLDEVSGLPVYCCGDIVGYGASPNDVARLLKDVRATCVLGNHDQAALQGDVSEFNARAAMAATWTSKHLSEESRTFLSSLPRETRTVIGGKRLYMTHGSPDDPMWEYVFPSTHSDLFSYYLRKVDADVIALGHTHFAFEWKGREGLLFNPGSVGQPRGGRDARAAAFAILTITSGADPGMEVEMRHVEYDVERSARRILESGLPASLASQLLSGEY